MAQTERKKTIKIGEKDYYYFDITSFGDQTRKLPFSHKILLENLLRKQDDKIVTQAHVDNLLSRKALKGELLEIPHHPGRILMQDFTGVPAVVDLAVMRDAVKDAGGDPEKINPLVPVDLVIDHSVSIDHFGDVNSLAKNVDLEYERNVERYSLLKWAQKSFKNFRVVPPNSGICHQVNAEYLGQCIFKNEEESTLYPDSLVGTDSHTTMINGLGIMGWGVGGIEAEAVMLGQPYYMPIPQVVAMKLTGTLPAGTTATDLVLTVTEKLRKEGVVGKFVEFIGPGAKQLSLPDRTTIANMGPEYGATMGFFPIDDVTIDYLKFTGRDEAAVITETYCKANGMWFTGKEEPEYSNIVELDLAEVQPSLAGPNRPQDRLTLDGTKAAMAKVLGPEAAGRIPVKVNIDGEEVEITDGSVVIASITSCTNTSNPAVMIGSGLIAKKAVELGLQVPKWVKTSLAPGSKAVQDYLEKSGLLGYMEQLGFSIAAFGCTTCIGNSGPLHPELEKAQVDHNIAYAAALSGNRNFEGRVHQHVKGSFLVSPLLVVAYALAGKIDLDLSQESLGISKDGKEIYLQDIWPSSEEIQEVIRQHVTKESYVTRYSTIFDGDSLWQTLPSPDGKTYEWDPKSTYIRKPPFFEGFSMTDYGAGEIKDAYPLLTLGDTITTDHISPAGSIKIDYPAGKYLLDHGVAIKDFNSYGSRRGNHEVMMRGTFGNIRIKNKLVGSKEGSFTLKLPEKTESYVYDAAMAYQKEGRDLVVLGGALYGTGSSRDWAAKGTILLGVKAVIAQSFERIHRSNLVGMGVLPLVFKPGESQESLGLTGTETYTVSSLDDLKPGQEITVTVTDESGQSKTFTVDSRLDTAVDVEYYQHGGILPYVIRKILS
jgi:aconitate hydratase